jgi:hypothetical protein
MTGVALRWTLVTHVWNNSAEARYRRNPRLAMPLEMIFQALMRRITDAASSHRRDDTEAAMRSTDWEFIFDDFDGWCVLHLSTYTPDGYWMYPTLLPNAQVSALKESLPSFSIHPSTAAYGHVTSGDDHWLEPYWREGDDFDNAEVQLYFDRSHYGRPSGKEHYTEFNQLVTHPLDLHWSEEKQAYCRLDKYGEEREKIKLIDTKELSLYLIRRRTLDKLLHLGKWVLVRYVDFRRWRSDHPPFDTSTRHTYEPATYEGKFEVRECAVTRLEYVEFRGAQIERPQAPKEQVLSWDSDDDDDEPKAQYAHFIVYDWKNQRELTDYSLAPTNFSNYFTKSDLPFEMSVLYFQAEVLDKYKNNPDKFTLRNGSIDCRGGWRLDTYDVNEHRQVHTYAVYLARLPYKEQLHWAQYNEKRKGPISKRAYAADFEGRFSGEPPPKLYQLQEALLQLSLLELASANGRIWAPKGGSWETASKGLYPLHTENSNQWHDFIIGLANATNEGFDVHRLRDLSKALNRDTLGPDGKPLGTLGLLKSIIDSLSPGDLQVTYGVLQDLQQRRGSGKAHGAWKTPDGSLVDDADKRLGDVIQAIRRLSEILGPMTASSKQSPTSTAGG